MARSRAPAQQVAAARPVALHILDSGEDHGVQVARTSSPVDSAAASMRWLSVRLRSRYAHGQVSGAEQARRAQWLARRLSATGSKGIAVSSSADPSATRPSWMSPAPSDPRADGLQSLASGWSGPGSVTRPTVIRRWGEGLAWRRRPSPSAVSRLPSEAAVRRSLGLRDRAGSRSWARSSALVPLR